MYISQFEQILALPIRDSVNVCFFEIMWDSLNISFTSTAIVSVFFYMHLHFLLVFSFLSGDSLHPLV